MVSVRCQAKLSGVDTGGKYVVTSNGAKRNDFLEAFGECLTKDELKLTNLVPAIEWATQVITLDVKVVMTKVCAQCFKFLYRCGERTQRLIGKFLYKNGMCLK